VVDSLDQEIGPATVDNNQGNAVHVLRNVNGLTFSVRVYPDGFAGPFETNVYYESADCSGQRYSFSIESNQFVHFGFVAGTEMVYAISVPQSRAILSRMRFQGGANTCLPFSATMSLAPTLSDDLSGFVPPFRLAR